MVRKGQRPGESPVGAARAAAPIEPVSFLNPRHPGLGLEVLSLAQLRERVPARHRTVRSRPDFHQIMLVESGTTEHDIDFVRHRCRAGSVLHLRPGQVQRFVRSDAARGWVLLFRPEFVPPDPALESPLGPFGAAAIALPRADRDRIRAAVRALAAAYDGADDEPLATRALQHLLLGVLLQVARVHEAARPEPQAPGMLRVYRRFLQLLEHRFAQTREVGRYAREIGCSAKTLSRACTLLAGESPKRLVEQRVVLEAKRLLAHSPLAVSAIGMELGFSEPTNFVKFFRRSEGVTPAAFRDAAL
ncbi:MAG TPA: helix-turn-helix transcriptional regulator [Albitalea sp.]